MQKSSQQIGSNSVPNFSKKSQFSSRKIKNLKKVLEGTQATGLFRRKNLK